MNCSISTRMPLPTARNAVPMAAVVLPFPGPVFTMMSPRRLSGITKFDCTYGLRFSPDQGRQPRRSRPSQGGDPGSNTITRVHLDDTIVAIATPPGRGGIGVVRLAGPEAVAIASPMLRLRHELEPGRAVFGEMIDPAAGNPTQNTSRIDEVVVTYFAKPHSYTTDDIVEISAH